MKYLLYALWISVIFLGAFIYPCVPNDFRYIFAFAIGVTRGRITTYLLLDRHKNNGKKCLLQYGIRMSFVI